MSRQDDEILARVKKGDALALGEYLDEHRGQLLAYIEGNMSAELRRKLESQDVLQEVSISALQSLAEIDLADRDPFLWLCQLAHRRIIDSHRRFIASQKRSAKREVPQKNPAAETGQGDFFDKLVVTMTTPSAAFSRNERHMRLEQAVAKLPDDAREALRLRYVENLPSKEVAERLGKSDGAVRVLLTRSLQRLQSLLGHESNS
jgi:RNA polymerase sigma-70 factor (ECF subfamily)